MFDSIIIGAGPAGLACALNLARNGKKVLLLEKESLGGQIGTSPKVENIPTFETISGAEFSQKLFEQVMTLGVDFDLDEVLSIEKNDKTFVVKTKGKQYETKTVVVAVGLVHRKTGLPNEEALEGKGISYCASCDGAFFKGQDVCVLGDANSAVTYALQLSNYCNTVYVQALFNHLFCEEKGKQALYSKPNIKVALNQELIEIKGTEKLESLVFKDKDTLNIYELKVSGMFVAIGQIPKNEIFKNLVDLDEHGYVIANEKMETKTPGLYAIGDCTKKFFRQVTTAINDGAIAAFACADYLNKN